MHGDLEEREGIYMYIAVNKGRRRQYFLAEKAVNLER